MAQLLTLESAKAYVAAYYAGCDGVERADIEGCGLLDLDGVEVCRLNVSVDYAASDNFAAARTVEQWDVWAEPREDGSFYLYGEC